MTKDLVAKLQRGIGMTDQELAEGISFYQRLMSDLELLGPTFTLATQEVRRDLTLLENFRWARGLE